MMLTALLLSQSMVTLAAPNADLLPGTGWSCSYNDVGGTSFVLEGDFPEVPKGRSIPTTIRGTAEYLFLGDKEADAFESRSDVRTYGITFFHTDGSRYNMVFLLVKDSDGLSIIDHYIPSADGGGKFHAYASGYCKSTFHAVGKGNTSK